MEGSASFIYLNKNVIFIFSIFRQLVYFFLTISLIYEILCIVNQVLNDIILVCFIYFFAIFIKSLVNFKRMVNGTAVTSAVGTAQSYFYTIVVGIVILLAGFGLGILAQKLLYKLLQEIGLNKIMNQ